MTKASKTKIRTVAILNTAWHYEAPGGDGVVKAGHEFIVKGDNYIAQSGDLVLKHWVQYGDASVIPAVHFDLFLEEVQIVEQVVRKPAKVEGKYIVAAE